MNKTVSVTLYSDVLCVWAYIAQARVDEIKRHFTDRVSIDYKFCSVFGDTEYKIGTGWADRGGFAAYGKHVRDVAAPFTHVRVHSQVWVRNRPASSTPAHLVLKAAQCVEPDKAEQLLREVRRAFFEDCLDVGSWLGLAACIDAVGISIEAIRTTLDSGRAHASLEADARERDAYRVQGSPTFVLNEGRQKLYGNVGYSVIEANIKELLAEPNAGAASWC